MAEPTVSRVDLTGRRVGNLVVISEAEPGRAKSGSVVRMWLCRCDCGNDRVVRQGHLLTGHTTRCSRRCAIRREPWNKYLEPRPCEHCRTPFQPKSNRVKFCCRACKGAASRCEEGALTDADIAAFWALVSNSDGCWLWSGTVGLNSYGCIQINNRKWLAHRLSYLLTRGDLPDDLHICHRCDNPRCVNPEHLFPGTDRDNAHDRMAKGRPQGRHSHPEAYPCGEQMENAKLTEDAVREMRCRYQAGGVTYRQLAEERGVSKCTAMRAIKGESWKGVK